MHVPGVAELESAGERPVTSQRRRRGDSRRQGRGLRAGHRGRCALRGGSGGSDVGTGIAAGEERQPAEEEHGQRGDDAERDDPRDDPEPPGRSGGVIEGVLQALTRPLAHRVARLERPDPVTRLTCAHDTPDTSATRLARHGSRDRPVEPRDDTSPVGQSPHDPMELAAAEHGEPVGG